MPATYAHYRFGCDVLKELPERFHLSEKQNRQLFMIGLHGPDILFYYHPFRSNPIKQHGMDLHNRIASSFFARALSVINSFEDQCEREGAIAYIDGVICHYVLDHFCHPHVYNLVDEGNFLHSEIESEFNRLLLLEDGFEPVGKVVTGHIVPSRFNARIISRFYPVTEPKTLLQALKSFIFCENMLNLPEGRKRNLVSFALRFSGNYNYLIHMMISVTPNPKLNESNLVLRDLYDKAVPLAVKLIHELESNLNGSLPLSHEYDHTFSRD